MKLYVLAVCSSRSEYTRGCMGPDVVVRLPILDLAAVGDLPNGPTPDY